MAASTSPRSDDAHSTVSQKVQNLIEEVLSWQKRNKTQDIPPKHGDDSEARNLGMRFAKLLLRREKALGAKPSEVQLSCGNFQMHWASNMFRFCRISVW